MAMTITILITLVGTALLCFAMPRHFALLLKRSLTRAQSHVLRAAGFVVLLIAAIYASTTMGVGYGLTAFTGVFTVTMISCAFLVTYLRGGSGA
ncbi:MAG: DUF3325 domain-containing protein [Pseudomonadota bacterium]